MFHAINTIRQATVALTLAGSLAVLTTPQALAGSGSSTYHDGWYGYAVALTKANQRPPTVDGRSPDTVDAAVQAHAPVVTILRSPGFEWGDFGLGVAAACGAMLLGLSIRILAARQTRKQPSSVATA